MKVCLLRRISSPAPEIGSNVLLTRDIFYRKPIPVLPWPNGTDGYFGRQHPYLRYFKGLLSIWCVNALPARYSFRHLIIHASTKYTDFPFLSRSDSGAEISGISAPLRSL